MQYVSKNNIENAKDNIEKILVDYGFPEIKVLAIDFTHFNEKSTNLFDIKFKMLAHEKYKVILDEEQKEKGKYAYFENKFNKIIRDLKKDWKNEEAEGLVFSEFSAKDQLINLDFDSNEWHNQLIEKEFGGCSIILSKQHGEAQSIVYLILSKALIKIDGDINFLADSDKIQDVNIRNCCEDFFNCLESLLIDEMVHCLHLDRWEAEKEKQIIIQYKEDLENKIDSFGHIVFNNLSGNLGDFLKICDHEENEPISKIYPYINNLQKRSNYINVVLQMLNKKDKNTVDALQDITTLKDMINFISKNYILEKAVDIIYNYPTFQNFSIESFQEDIFVLLWNLLNNTDKHNYIDNNILGNSIYFDVLVEQNIVFMVFKNISDPKKKEILKNILDGKEKLLPRKGMWVVLEIIKKLNWKIELKEEENPKSVNLWITTNFPVQTLTI